MLFSRRFRVLAGWAAVGFVAACATPQRSADTTSALAMDTMKTGATVLAAPPPPNTNKSVVSPAPIKSSATKKTSSSTTKSVTARDTAHLGRDSVIQINPRDPRRQLPTVPPKKPPR